MRSHFKREDTPAAPHSAGARVRNPPARYLAVLQARLDAFRAHYNRAPIADRDLAVLSNDRSLIRQLTFDPTRDFERLPGPRSP